MYLLPDDYYDYIIGPESWICFIIIYPMLLIVNINTINNLILDFTGILQK